MFGIFRSRTSGYYFKEDVQVTSESLRKIRVQGFHTASVLSAKRLLCEIHPKLSWFMGAILDQVMAVRHRQMTSKELCFSEDVALLPYISGGLTRSQRCDTWRCL